jgi:hypothetical protein
MIRKITLTLLLVFLLGILVPGSVTAQSGLAVLDTSVVINFPAGITFNITAESGADITDIRLHYTVDRMMHSTIVSEIPLAFAPSTRVTAQWIWDMRMSGGMPPGSSIDCWWTLTDAAGAEVETAPVTVNIEDNRYDWHSIAQGNVTLYWYEGDDDFAGELMDAVQAALSRLDENTGAELEDPVRLYIYANSTDLRGSMIFPQEWTGGVAFTEYGVIAIGINPDSSLEWGKRAIAHELTHLVVHQVTFNPYNTLPTWLDEGLAMTAEGELGPEFVSVLSEARDNDLLKSIRSLASPFSAYTSESLLGYAESHEVVKYLIGEYGRDRMLELLNTFEQGSGYDEALLKVYGFDMDGLNSEWNPSGQGGIPTSQPTFEVTTTLQPMVDGGVSSVIIGLIAGLVTVIFLLAALFMEGWSWRRGF